MAETHARKHRLVFARVVILLAIIGAAVPEVARADASCVYVNAQGEMTHVRSAADAPSEFRSRVVCKEIAVDEIVDPKDLDVGNDARTASFTTDLGTMKARWSRSVEKCFSSAPSRAVSEAARAVNRALKSSRFTTDVKYARREWSLGFIDKTAAFSQFPVALSLGGHPGFMIPPSRIYIITDFVTPDCAGASLADEALTQVLLHEMGHVVEYIMLGERDDLFDRQRAEGFAAWFEQYSADFTSVIPHGSVKQQYAELARHAPSLVDRSFAGSPEDYAAAALLFQAIVDKKGIAGLMNVYKVIREERLPFYEAVERGVAWNRATLERQAEALKR